MNFTINKIVYGEGPTQHYYEIAFDYDPDVVAFVKADIWARKWNKQKKCWVVAASCAKDLEDLSKKLAQRGWKINGLNLLRSDLKRDEALAPSPRAELLDELHPVVREQWDRFRESFDFHLEPYRHQEAALAWLNVAGSGMLFDEMGLGKTKEAIDYGRLLMWKGEISKVIIVAPASLKLNWAKEIKMNGGDGEIIIVKGTPKQRAEAEEYAGMRTGPTWIIYNYEQIWRGAEKKEVAPKSFIDLCTKSLLIADEAHRLKNDKAKQSKAFKKVSRLAKHVVLMTGTPVVNSAEDLFNLTDLVSPGRLGTSRYAFLDRCAIFENNGFANVVVGYKNLDRVKARIAPVSLRRTKDQCLDLPPKIYSSIDVEMTAQQNKAYVELVTELRTELRNLEGESVQVIVEHALPRMIRLQQCADGFVGSPGNWLPFDDGGAKLSVVDSLLEDIVSADKKLVIWSRFRPPIDVMLERYKAYRPVCMHGGISQANRDRALEDFTNNDKVKLFIGQVHTAGVGITLTAASDELFISQWWSPAVNKQAEDRLHRIGQHHPVNVYRLLAQFGPTRGLMDDVLTIDEIVAKALDEKQSLADDLTGDAGVIKLKEMMAAAGIRKEEPVER